jgi:transcriptional accessory protein Tex/SPT6
VLKSAIEDGYKRLIQPSIEREIRKELTEKAEDQAIHIFAENLRKLLLHAADERKARSRRRSGIPHGLQACSCR